MPGIESEPSGASQPERRRSPRVRVLKNALIIFNRGQCSMPCHILNQSETGALIAPSDITLCPDEFVLRPLVGPARNCEVVFRKNTRVGVRFL